MGLLGQPEIGLSFDAEDGTRGHLSEAVIAHSESSIKAMFVSFEWNVDRASRSSLKYRYYVHPVGPRLRLSDGFHGRALPGRLGQGDVDNVEEGILFGSAEHDFVPSGKLLEIKKKMIKQK
jgi:hypothetical protein